MALEGNLETFYLSSLFQLLTNDKKTGKLRITHDDDVVTVHFCEGTIVSATSSDNEKQLGHLLRSEGVIGSIELEKHLHIARNRKERLGKVLVDECFISKEELDTFVRMQVENILYTLFHWMKGKFRFEECAVSLADAADTQFETMELILEASRRVDEMSVLEKQIPARDQVLRYTAEAATVNRQTALNNQENAVLRLVNGTNTIKDIIYQSGYDEFTVVKALYTLLSAGIVDVKEKTELSLKIDESRTTSAETAAKKNQEKNAPDIPVQDQNKRPSLPATHKIDPGAAPGARSRFFRFAGAVAIVFTLSAGAVLLVKMGFINYVFRLTAAPPVDTQQTPVTPVEEIELPEKNLPEVQSLQDKNSFFFLNLPSGFTYLDSSSPRKSKITASYKAHITVSIEAQRWFEQWHAEDAMYEKIGEFQDGQSDRTRTAIESHALISMGGGQGYKITSAETINASLCMTHVYTLVGHQKIISIHVTCKNCKQAQTGALFTKVDETIKKSLLIYP